MHWYIGTSGWSYARWIGRFYPAGLAAPKRLAFYARHFNAVEINNSFYSTPSAEQISKWENSVPDDFTFCIKASRQITHHAKLADAEHILPPLLNALSAQIKPSPVLFQLPPRFPCDLQLLTQFLKHLPQNRRYAMEFRDAGWHHDEVYTLLGKYNVAFCLFEKAAQRSPRLRTADFTYVRLHGRKKNYGGNYSRNILTGWHDWLAEQERDAYVFFDNTDEELYAIENARLFRQLAEKQ